VTDRIVRRPERMVLTGATAVGLLAVSCGLAAAEPVPIQDVSRTESTDAGWRLDAALTNMTVNSVPNMAGTAFTREGFVSGKATAVIDGDGNLPVMSGNLVLAAQVGCQIDVSGGASFGVSDNVGNGNGILGSNLANLIGVPNLSVSPNISLNANPGKISTVGLGSKELKGRLGTIYVHDAHIKIDGCTGPVVVRLVAYMQISTDNGDDSVNVYGDLVSL
jgi:hypothetical protein